MALVSIKNFVAPFTNRVHLGTIIGVVVLFAVFSAADGRLSFNLPPRPIAGDRGQPRGTAPSLKHALPDTPASLDDLDPTRELSKLGIDTTGQPPAPHRSSSRTEQQPTAADGDLLDSMMGRKGAVKDPQGGKNQGDLDEVERRLGLR